MAHIKHKTLHARNVVEKVKVKKLENGEFSEVHVIGDLECPNCYHLVAFWQGKLI